MVEVVRLHDMPTILSSSAEYSGDTEEPMFFVFITYVFLLENLYIRYNAD